MGTRNHPATNKKASTSTKGWPRRYGRKKKRLKSQRDRGPIVRRARGTVSPGKRVLHTTRGCRGKARSRRPQSVRVFPRGTQRAHEKSSTKNRCRESSRECLGRERHRVVATRC